MTPPSAPDPLAPVRERLAAIRRQREHLALARAVIRAAWVAVAWVFATALVEAVAHTAVGVRVLLVCCAVAGAGAVSLWFTLPPILRALGILQKEAEEELAKAIGNRTPGLRDRLLNALQLAAHPDPRSSSTLTAAALEDAARETGTLDFAVVVERSPLRTEGRRAAVVIGAAVLVLLAWQPVGDAANRLIHYDAEFTAPSRFRIIVEPGDREIVRGDDVRIRVRVEGESPEVLRLLSRPDGQRNDDEHGFSQGDDGTFSTILRSLTASTTYRVRAGDEESRPYRLTVSDRPGILRLTVELTPPSYTGRALVALDDNVGEISALKGTGAALRVMTTHPIQSASIVFRDGRRIPMRTAESTARAHFTVTEPTSYHIVLEDARGLSGLDPVEYAVRIVQDAYPTAVILVPGRNIDITDASSLALLFRVSDDFGISRARLAYRLIRSRYEQPAVAPTMMDVPLPRRGETELLMPFTWTLQPLRLAPEDVVEYFLEVDDNDRISGPKRAESERFTLRLPSLDEVLSDANQETESGRQELEKTLHAAEEAARVSEELRRDLRKEERATSWENRRKAEELARSYERMQLSVDQAKQALEQAMQRMEQGKVLSPETLQKFRELQQVLQELNSPEFAETMKRLQQALQQMTPEAMRQALQNFSFSEETFRKGLERTLALLKRVQIEQKLDEALRRTEEARDRLEELARRSGDAGDRDAEERRTLKRQQEEIRSRVNDLERQLAELQKRMEEFPAEMPLEELQKARQQLTMDSLDQRLHQAGARMDRQEFDESRALQHAAAQSLQQLGANLKGMQQNLRKTQQRQVVNAMRRAVQDLLELSQRQEALKKESGTLDSGSPQYRRNAQEQMENLRDLSGVIERLSAVGQKTFGVTPEMGRALGQAMRDMNEALQALDARNGSTASDRQTAAMTSLNEAARLVQGALQSLMQGGGQGMGMAGFLQRLQGLGERQDGINQGTQGLSGMTQEQAATMARLAAEQAMVRKSLEQLSREASQQGDLSRLLGDLNRIAQEMREVQTDLSQGQVTQETLRKQERILSRLLDSQRSTRERDFEERRKAESGRSTARSKVTGLDPAALDGTRRLRRDLLRALEEGYAPDYQELIRRYYEALESRRNEPQR